MSQGDEGGGNDLTKGLWTPQEDATLVKYVMENGERKWNDVSRKLGLMRCGNSCRLRWFNHLRSNLKKGDFTPEEENTILKLHAKYGNRWSHLASHLPGRTDNEIKNYWNIRLRRRLRAGLPIYPPEILREMHHRRFNTQKLEQPPKGQIQLSSSLSFPQNPDFSSFPSSSSSSFEENPNFNCIPSSHQTNTPSILTIQENPESSSINSMSLIELAMSYPLLIATLFPPINMYQFNLHSDDNGGVVLSPPSSQNLNLSNSPYTPVFAGSQLAPSDIDTIQMDIYDPFLSENFETIEIPSIQSCFEAITPTSSSTNGSDHFIVTSKGEDNYNMDPDLCSGRNSGLLQDVLRQSAALLSSQLPYKQSENDQPAEGRLIMHDDSVAKLMNHPNSTNVNLESGFGSSTDDMNHVDDLSSFFSSNGKFPSSSDIGVLSDDDVFENLNMMNDLVDLEYFPPSGTPQASTEPANASDGTMAPATEIQGELVPCPVPTTPTEIGDDWATDVFSLIDTNPADTNQEYAQELMGSQIEITLIEQERDWALGCMPSFC